MSRAAEAPWTLAPAAAMFAVVLAVNLCVQGTAWTPLQVQPVQAVHDATGATPGQDAGHRAAPDDTLDRAGRGLQRAVD